MRLFGVALAMLVALTGAPAGQAGRFDAAAGDFDYFLLSLSIAPSVCSLSPANRAKQECQTLPRRIFSRRR
jgi:hypothetical protein